MGTHSEKYLHAVAYQKEYTGIRVDVDTLPPRYILYSFRSAFMRLMTRGLLDIHPGLPGT